MLPEPIAATISVTATLEKLGVRYLICGALACTVHGLVRTTQNSDDWQESRIRTALFEVAKNPVKHIRRGD